MTGGCLRCRAACSERVPHAAPDAAANTNARPLLGPRHQALPLEVDLEALRPPGTAGAELQLPRGFAAPGGLTKRDVHGDIGALVVHLDWPE